MPSATEVVTFIWTMDELEKMLLRSIGRRSGLEFRTDLGSVSGEPNEIGGLPDAIYASVSSPHAICMENPRFKLIDALKKNGIDREVAEKIAEEISG